MTSSSEACCPQRGVDFEVDGEAFAFPLAEAVADFVEGNGVNTDVFVGGATSGVLPFQIGGEKDVGGFGGHSRGGGRTEQGSDVGGVVAGFLEEVAAGGIGGGFRGACESNRLRDGQILPGAWKLGENFVRIKA